MPPINNISQELSDSEMSLLQGQKVIAAVDNLEPIMEGVLIKTNDVHEVLKEIKEKLEEPKEERQEVQKVSLEGVSVVTIQGEKGDKGDTPTTEELIEVIKPLIPPPLKGDKGDSPTKTELMEIIEPLIPDPIKGDTYTLTEEDKEYIASCIDVPVVEKIIEKIEVVKEVTKKETPKQLKDKIEKLGIDYDTLSNTPDINKIVSLAKQASKTVSLVELDDVNTSNLTQTNGKYNLGSGNVESVVAGTNITVDNTDPNNPIISSSGGGGGTGTVTNFSFVDVNGFTGTVANPSTTPELTIDVSGLDATKIADGTVTNEEFQYLGGVTSDLQTQLNGLVPYIGATSPVELAGQQLRFSANAGIDWDKTGADETSLSGGFPGKRLGFFGAGNAWSLFDNSLLTDGVDRYMEIPNIDGRITASVNNQTPDAQGNVTIPTGYSLFVVSSNTTTSQTNGNNVYLVDATSGNVEITLNSAINNIAAYTFKKTDNTANTVTITGGIGSDGQEYIDGSVSKVINIQNEAFTILSDNAGWRIISEETPDPGVYTPTLTDVANCTSTAYDLRYSINGNIVNVWGKVNIDPTLAATSTQLGISLPISSTFANDYDCSGTGACATVAGMVGAIFADVTNNRAQLEFISSDINANDMFINFSYLRA